MKLLKLALTAGAAALALPAPANAQMNMNMPGMQMPGMKMPMPKKKPAKKKATAKKTTSTKSAGKETAKKTATRKAPTKHPSKSMPSMRGMDMSGHDKSAMPGMKMPESQSMPGMAMPPDQTMPGMAMPPDQTMPGMSMTPGQTMPGMSMPQGQSMPGMNMPGMVTGANADAEAAGTNLPAGNTPAPPVPTDHAADRVYGSQAMAMGRHHLQTFHGGQKFFQVFNNLMEYQARNGRDGYQWDSEAWYGGDINRLWLKSEGDGTFGKGVDRAEVQSLYSHAIDPYFNLQGGVRYDFRPNPSRVYATIGIEGLAPSFFEVEGALFLSNKGELMARAEGYYDQRITQRLILQPRVELNLAAQNSRDIRTGAGLSDAELGLRLRYDISRQFSPYLGVQYRRAFGRTRTYLKQAGEDAGGWAFVAGVRTWF